MLNGNYAAEIYPEHLTKLFFLNPATLPSQKSSIYNENYWESY
jgi:hypothetical protein